MHPTKFTPLVLVAILSNAASGASSTIGTRTLPNAPSNGVLPFPFQLLSQPQQLGNLVGLLANFTQFFNKPQLGTSTPATSRIFNFNSSDNPIYTTLPFNDLNLTEFSWIWNNLMGQNNQTGTVPQPKLGGGSTTYADLNFFTIPQLFSMLGR